nr:hypothetical protein [Tanacetum cinerariifolium]
MSYLAMAGVWYPTPGLWLQPWWVFGIASIPSFLFSNIDDLSTWRKVKGCKERKSPQQPPHARTGYGLTQAMFFMHLLKRRIDTGKNGMNKPNIRSNVIGDVDTFMFSMLSLPTPVSWLFTGKNKSGRDDEM